MMAAKRSGTVTGVIGRKFTRARQCEAIKKPLCAQTTDWYATVDFNRLTLDAAKLRISIASHNKSI